MITQGYEDYFRKSTFDKVTGKLKEGFIIYGLACIITFVLMNLFVKPFIYFVSGTICFFSYLSKKIYPETELEQNFKTSLYKDRLKEEKKQITMERKEARQYNKAYQEWENSNTELVDPRTLSNDDAAWDAIDKEISIQLDRQKRGLS